MGYFRHLFLLQIVVLLYSISGCVGYETRIHVHEKNQCYVLHVPISKLVLTIPMNNFIKKENRLGGATNSPRYFFFEDEIRKIIISGWFESEKELCGVSKFRENELKNYTQLKLPIPQDAKFNKFDNWDVISYDMCIKNHTNTHIRAHWIQAGTWIDLHISITNNSSSTANRLTLLNILKTIRIDEY